MSSTLANLPWLGDSRGRNTLPSVARKLTRPWTFIPSDPQDDALHTIFHQVRQHLEERTDEDLVRRLQWDTTAVQAIHTAIGLAGQSLPDAEYELAMPSVEDTVARYVLYVTSTINVPDLLAARARFIDIWISHDDNSSAVVHVAFRPRD